MVSWPRQILTIEHEVIARLHAVERRGLWTHGREKAGTRESTSDVSVNLDSEPLSKLWMKSSIRVLEEVREDRERNCVGESHVATLLRLRSAQF